LEEVVASHQPVTFRAVARAGNVSIDFLYREAGLRARIEELRAAGRSAEPVEAPSRSTVVHSLTQQLRELRAENQDLRRRLEAAHGEIVVLKRTGGRRGSIDREEDEHARPR
jgi:tRNA(Arg) A34 adenosine deaminase TadA